MRRARSASAAPCSFSEYWNNPEATAQTLKDGWLHTGDLGHRDADGYYFITDREKDLIIRGGENIGCQEVEAVLYEHPAITECVVFGVPDERLGETVAAVVVARGGALLTAGDVRSHVSDHLARFKVPEHVWVETEQLPRTASGKIHRQVIRRERIDELEAAAAPPLPVPRISA